MRGLALRSFLADVSLTKAWIQSAGADAHTWDIRTAPARSKAIQDRLIHADVDSIASTPRQFARTNNAPKADVSTRPLFRSSHAALSRQHRRTARARDAPRAETAHYGGRDYAAANVPEPPGRASKITEPPRPPPHGIPPPRARVFLASVPATKNAGSNVCLYALGGQGSCLQTPRSSAGKPSASCLKFPRQR